MKWLVIILLLLGTLTMKEAANSGKPFRPLGSRHWVVVREGKFYFEEVDSVGHGARFRRMAKDSLLYRATRREQQGDWETR